MSPAFADYPGYSDLFINDYAEILSMADADEIRTELQSLKTHKDIEAVLVTINSYSTYETGDLTFESFATNLFNTWGIGNEQTNTGILILFSRFDRTVRIELGKGYSSSYDRVMKSIIDNIMLPDFKKEEYSEGLKNGISNLTISMMSNESDLHEYEAADLKKDAVNPVVIIILIMSAGAGIAGFILIRRFLRFRPRMCADRGVKMEMLDEALDDNHLNKGQQTEEMINSVDYDVWYCSQCEKKEIHRYGKWFSGYRGCRQCSYKTMRVSRQTITAATYSSSGTGMETGNCVQCGYHYQTTYTIPRLERSTSSGSGSSSSGSFSGGSSSGGGASGSW